MYITKHVYNYFQTNEHSPFSCLFVPIKLYRNQLKPIGGINLRSASPTVNINTEEEMLFKDQDDKMMMLHDPSPPKINNKAPSTSRRAKLQDEQFQGKIFPRGSGKSGSDCNSKYSYLSRVKARGGLVFMSPTQMKMIPIDRSYQGDQVTIIQAFLRFTFILGEKLTSIFSLTVHAKTIPTISSGPALRAGPNPESDFLDPPTPPSGLKLS
eukprot:sb/3470193/